MSKRNTIEPKNKWIYPETYKVSSHIHTIIEDNKKKLSELKMEIDYLKEILSKPDEFYMISLGDVFTDNKGIERSVNYIPDLNELRTYGVKKWLKVKEEIKREGLTINNILYKKLERIKDYE